MITHIVPLFAPAIDGVGDYALRLARNLRERFDLPSRFLVCDPAWINGGAIDGFEALGPIGCSKQSLAARIGDASTILLHYVGYGYDRNGAPEWLANALNEWSAATPGARLLTVFHEIWSQGPPWRKVFYVAPKQKRLAVELLKLSEHAFTSTIWMAAELERMRPGHVTRLPIPSALCATVLNPRRSRVAPPWAPMLFGQAWTRLPAVKAHRKLLETLLRRGELECVLVMGKDSRRESADIVALREFLPREKMRALGEVSEENGPAGFAEADFYLSPHAARDACKSSALMAAFACGCPAVLPGDSEPTPLEEGKHFVVSGRFFERSSRLPEIGRAAREWYLANADWPIISEAIGRKLAPAAQAKA